MKRLVALAGLGAVVMACGGITNQSDTDSPIVLIISPKADSTVGGTVNFAVQALDGFGVDSVVFKVDGVAIGTDISTPFSVSWNTRASGNGAHALRAEAYDPSGNVGFNSISVTVDNTKQ